MKNVSGPTIAGCKLDSAKASISVSLDPDRMGGEDVLVQPFDINVSAWSGDDSSTMMVCTGQLESTLANASSCACSGWAYLRIPNPKDPTNHGHDQSLWYCEVGPGWKPSQQQTQLSIERHSSAVSEAAQSKVAFTSGRGGATAGLGWVPNRNPYEAIWQPATVTKGPVPHSLSVDLRSVNGSASGGAFFHSRAQALVFTDQLRVVVLDVVYAIRYAWPFSGDSCCPQEAVHKGLEICRPAACPVLSASTNLPMNGFFATFEVSLAADYFAVF
eukprot:COSAG02_NODE_3887_length_6085_cov_3.846809_4_plen_273_part_00